MNFNSSHNTYVVNFLQILCAFVACTWMHLHVRTLNVINFYGTQTVFAVLDNFERVQIDLNFRNSDPLM